MMNRFVPEGHPTIDNVTVFAGNIRLRDLIGQEYWISMPRLLYELYHEVLQPNSQPKWNTDET
eukprot:4632079-Prymnesium_polylepis.1